MTMTMTGSRWTDEFLESMRYEGDPIADAVIAEVFALGQVGRVNELLAELHQNSDPVPTDLPPLRRSFFQEVSALPAWADQPVGTLGSRAGGHQGLGPVHARHAAGISPRRSAAHPDPSPSRR